MTELEKEIESYWKQYEKWLEIKPELPPLLKAIVDEKKLIIENSKGVYSDEDEKRLSGLECTLQILPREYSVANLKTMRLLNKVIDNFKKNLIKFGEYVVANVDALCSVEEALEQYLDEKNKR